MNDTHRNHGTYILCYVNKEHKDFLQSFEIDIPQSKQLGSGND